MRDNSLAFWFPILKQISEAEHGLINLPKTIILDVNKFDKNCVPALKKAFWSEELEENDKKSLGSFLATLRVFAKGIGYPLFVRSGMTSYKHEWLESCYVPDEQSLPVHVNNISEHSQMADMQGGWPINVWVMRELIPTKPIFTAFNGFPVTREFRIFFRDGKVECVHPYWPKESLDGHTEDKEWESKLEIMNTLSPEDERELTRLSEIIAEKFEGWWSLDWLQAANGQWYAIDMAMGENSYHFPGCKFEVKDIK